MKKYITTLLILFITISSYCQINDTYSKFNFDFELTEKGKPKNWNIFGSSNYTFTLDSTNVKSGKYSASIDFKEGKSSWRSWGFTIPDNYEGKKITLSGYIKTENITDGYAGIWMRIDPSIAFDNMENRGIKGTTDWTKYEITLDMNPEKTKKIALGGLLEGKGKMWIDDLNVFIDGKDIKDLKPKIIPAEKDKEFDKGSGITGISVDKNLIKNLKNLGLIWGFLKYHHPNIARGDYNWDYELFRILPKILNPENNKNQDEIMVKWINNLGQFSQKNEIAVKSFQVKIEPDLGWIKNSGFSDELTTLLLNVKNADRKYEHYYLGLQQGVGNPIFEHENAYPSIKYDDAGFRLLTLFKYWNIIQYYFPYKNLIEEDWKKVLEEFIFKFIDAKDDTRYMLSVLELIGRIHDTHANIWSNHKVLNNYFGLRYAAFEITFIENKPVVTSFYAKKLGNDTGLEIGDIISAIDNKPVAEIVREKLKYHPASNYPTKLRDIARNLLRTNDSTINVEYIRNDKIESTTLKTFPSSELNIRSKFSTNDTCFKLINKEISYINNSSLKRKYLPKIWNEIQNTKGLIIDNRNYPSDFPVHELSRYLMPDVTPFVKMTNGSIESPGLFTFFKNSSTVGKKNEGYYKGKVVILINEISQSASEYSAMGYRVNPNAIIVGSTTAGADGNVSQIYLPSGISTMISGLGVYYPDGKETQRIGIVPDFELKPTVQGIKNGEDELLNKAIEIINQQ